MTKTDRTEPERLRLHPSQLIAGALAAVTGAALSARLGVAGTLAGTAAISVISGIASTLYEHSVRRTRVAMEQARAKLAERQSMPITRRAAPEDTMLDADVAAENTTAGSPSVWWRRIPRRRVAFAGAATLATFVLAIGIITSIELIHGKPLSGQHSGTTITRAFEGHSDGHRPAPSPTPGQNPKPSGHPSPSGSPTPTPSPSQQESKADPSPPQDSGTSPSPTQASPTPPAQKSNDNPPSEAPSDPPSDQPSDQPSDAPSDQPTPAPSQPGDAEPSQ